MKGLQRASDAWLHRGVLPQSSRAPLWARTTRKRPAHARAAKPGQCKARHRLRNKLRGLALLRAWKRPPRASPAPGSGTRYAEPLQMEGRLRELSQAAASAPREDASRLHPAVTPCAAHLQSGWRRGGSRPHRSTPVEVCARGADGCPYIWPKPIGTSADCGRMHPVRRNAPSSPRSA